MTKEQINKELGKMPETFDRIMEVVEAIERQKEVALIIYPGYCYWWLEDDLDQTDEIYGDDRLDAIYKAVRWYMENEYV